jgi:hypothetical protein
MQEPKYPLTAPYRANAVRDERLREHVYFECSFVWA